MGGIEVGTALLICVSIVLALVLPMALVWIAFKLLMAVVWLAGLGTSAVIKATRFTMGTTGNLVGRSATFVRDEVGDTLSFAGGVVTAIIFSVLALGQVVLGRWAGANHYGRAIEEEYRRSGLALYRVVLGNPARLLGLNAVTEGIERRLPDVIARAPRGDRPGKLREFDGYRVLDTLPRGGSGAWLFLAEASKERREQFALAGHPDHERVVIKSFSLDEGSTLPQIVRESRALEAARDMGLVLDHELSSERFYYAMPYVPGSDLGAVTRQFHERAGSEGLDAGGLSSALAFAGDVLETLTRFHTKGLWHKDIKPSNVIVATEGPSTGIGDPIERAHLVDLGLVTPLRSAMTLTTHGTEYFRDPEMVRLAMQGAKVHEVDGVKFDLYSVGALLYSMLENSFPAHGSLSRITKRCPEALHWIVRRAMADMSQRYGTADEMLRDVRAVLAADNPYGMKPAQLPSMGGVDAPAFEPVRRAASWTPAQQEPGSAPTVSGSTTPSKRRAKVGGGVFLAAMLLVFCLVPAIVIPFFTLQEPSAHPTPFDVAAPTRARGPSTHVGNGPTLGLVPDPHRQFSPAEIEELAPRFSSYLGADTEHWRGWLEKLDNVLAQPTGRGQRHPRLLVLSDLSAQVDHELLSVLEFTLEQGHFERVDELELLARANSIVGLSDPGDEASVSRLSAFVDDVDELDAVLWLEESDAPGTVLYRIVTADESVDPRRN